MIKRFIVFSLLINSIIISQDKLTNDDQLIVVKTTNYNTYVGTIQSDDNDIFTIDTYDGKQIELKNNEILLTYDFKGRVKNSRLQRLDPNSSFYLFSPSAFSIDNGNLYFRDFCLFYPSINYGIADIVSLQAGAFWYPGMNYDKLPYVGNIKFTAFQSDIVSFAGGASYIHLPDLEEQEIYSAGYAYATITIGNRYNHGSVSAGWGYIQEEDEWSNEEKPIVVVAGNFRILNSISFVTENWIFPDRDIEDSLLSASLRFFGRQVALDVGVLFSATSFQDKIDPIPILNITYHLR